jgi:DNA-binding response OmpR family regulator
LEKLIEISGGYPALLRACCEAYAAGAAPELEAMRAHPAVRRRVDEFWRDAPIAEYLQHSGLARNALLGSAPGDIEIDTTGLTAAEFRLWAYFQNHAGQVCSKDELIQAVWPEEVQVEGLRDDSLAQLVRRLRRKIEPKPTSPARILTVPGRGYRFIRS